MPLACLFRDLVPTAHLRPPVRQGFPRLLMQLIRWDSRSLLAACRSSRQIARSPLPGQRIRHRRPPYSAGRPPVSLSLYFWPVISASRVSTVSSCFFTLPTISAPTMFPSLSTIYVVG